MQGGVVSGGSLLLGNSGLLSVDRGIAEFRAGRPVVVNDGTTSVAVFPVEALDDARLAEFTEMCSPHRPGLAITARRAQALGVAGSGPLTFDVGGADAARLLALAGGPAVQNLPPHAPAEPGATAGIHLAKLAERLPAVLVASCGQAVTQAPRAALITVDANSVGGFRKHAARSLRIASEANVPLQAEHDCRLVIFTDAIGETSTAVIVGAPDIARPVPVRMHSACLTGDVFGSRRCDCGDQLRLALTSLADLGGGIVLYLPQEGRGLGIANKMRAYQLQDTGLDTVDANTTLGFDEDERNYAVAARMLELLGALEVMLLTNNPAKVQALRENGIKVTERLPLMAPINADNRRYLTAKATRAGHHLDHLKELLDAGE
jgi:GTP cyclohydrolase II